MSIVATKKFLKNAVLFLLTMKNILRLDGAQVNKIGGFYAMIHDNIRFSSKCKFESKVHVCCAISLKGIL